MASAEDPRDGLMWEKDVLVTSEELKSYAANYPPMGVYIPRGRVKVPHRRTRCLPQISQSAKGKPNSPNLLMIKPPVQTTNMLPPIDIYGNSNCDTLGSVKRHNVGISIPQETVQRAPEIRTPIIKLETCDSMTSRYLHPRHNASNGMSQSTKSVFSSDASSTRQSTVPSALPPPYVDARIDNVAALNSQNPFHPDVTSLNPFHPDVTSLIKKDMRYPLGPQYYHHLSAIAAMAWSDCNQATEKLRRIYEETAHLSRSCDPRFLHGGITDINPPMYTKSPAKGTVAPVNVTKNHAPYLGDSSTARCHQLAKDHEWYLSHPTSNAVTVNPTTNVNYRTHCDVKKQANILQTQSPIPGTALYEYQRAFTKPNSNMLYDVVNRREYARQNMQPSSRAISQKRKMCETEQFDLSFNKKCEAKVPRMDPVTLNYFQHYDNPSTSQSMLIPETAHKTQSRPPPYECIFQHNLQRSIPDLLKKVVRPESAQLSKIGLMTNKSISDVIGTSPKFNDRLCFPSVSFSPSQPPLNMPFVVQ